MGWALAKAMVESIARQTLNAARGFLAEAELIGFENQDRFLTQLQGAIVFGRSATFHLQKEYSGIPGFADWYESKQKRLGAIPLCRLFLEMRNAILKEGPPQVRRNTTVAIGTAAEADALLGIRVIRAGPWYRRSPQVAWSDLTAPLRRCWHRFWQRHGRRASSPVEKAETSRITRTWRFDDPAWYDYPAVDLVKAYLDILDPLIDEAEMQVGKTSSDL